MVIALTTLVMASTIFSGLSKSFNFLFSSNALFSLDFTVAISAAWALILFCLFLELWDTSSSMSSFYTATNVVLTTFVHLPLLLNIRANQPQNWVKLLESGEDKHSPLATILKYESLRFWVNWCFKAWFTSVMNSGLQAAIFLTNTCSSSTDISWLSLAFWPPIVKVHYQWTDILSGLKCEAEMIYHPWKDCLLLGVKPR